MTVINLVENIVMNFFSSQLYDGKASIFEKIRFKCFHRKLLKWARQYINSHDGTVLTTSDFEKLLKDYHLIENIFSQVANADSSVSREFFINEQVELFHSIQIHPEQNCYDTDDILKSFIAHFYDEINAFYLKQLSSNEKYIVSRSEAVGHSVIDTIQKNADVMNAGIGDIKELLSKQSEIGDLELVWIIYQTLSKSILSGKVGEVMQIYPLLSGKSKDLEKSISYLLSLFSSKGGYAADFDQIQKDIIDSRIYDDVCRITIYLNSWRGNKSELSKIGNRNSDLKSIAQSLIDGNYEEFYTVDRSEKAGITYFAYQVENHYPDEQWIVKRICVLDILKQPVFNASESIKQIIETPDNILDRVIFLERRLSELYNKLGINIDDVKSLYEEVSNLSNTTTELAIDFKEKIFEMLMRLALLISNEEAERVMQIVPDDLHGCKNIDFLLLEIELGKGAFKLDELVNTCMKYDEYWVFNNYLVEKVNDNPKETKQLIEKYLFVIDKDPSIFLIYAQLVNDLDEPDKAVNLLSKYQEKYGKYIEFWIVKMRIMYNDTEMSNVIANYKRGWFKRLSNNGSFDLIRLLMQRKMYEDALEIIKINEMIGNITVDIIRCKAIALCNTKHEIESLSVFTSIFESGNQNEEIVYYILALSFNNRRTVPNSILFCAEKSENPQILALVASNYVMNNSIEKARNMNIKAMLRTTENQSDVFNQFLGLETLGNLSEEIQIKGVSDDTVVYLKSDDGTIAKTYVIHSQHLLPKEPYCWENANHIYKETAIELGLFRKKLGDTICLDEKSYVIESIDSLDAYFFRISISKVVDNGKAIMLSIPVTEDNKIDTERFAQIVKDAIGDSKNQFTWLDQYKDLSQIPITFYFSKRFVRGTYFQLVSAVIEDKSILYREGLSEMDLSKGDYVLSHAALVVLYKLSWKGSCGEPKYAIPEVLKKVISDETEEVIRENNREHVSFMGVNDNQLYMIESTEEDKNRYMQDAVEFKSYCKNYYTIGNESDLHITNENHIDIKDVLGIADYDSLLIAKNEQRILVSAEMMVSGISQMSEIGVRTICIADFLSEEADSVEELLTYVRKMIEYKFTLPFTTKTVYRILEFFNKANEEEKKYIISQWSSILNLPVEDEIYKKVMAFHVRDCILNMKIDEDRINSINRCLIESWLKYTGQRPVASLNETEGLVTEIVKAET